MSKNTKLVALVVAIAVAYPAASWYTGKRVEAEIASNKDQTAYPPYFKIVKQDYQRGVFSSEQDITLELDFAKFPSSKKPGLPGAEAESLAGNDHPPSGDADVMQTAKADNYGEDRQALQVRVINHIKHGPLPGFTGFGAARIQTEFVLDDVDQAKLTKLFGNAKAVEITTRLGYAGGGHLSVSSPAITTETEKDHDKVAWQGIKLEMDFAKNYSSLSMSANAPGLTVDSVDGQSFKLGAVSLKAEMTRAYPTGAPLFLGKSEMGVESINFVGKPETKTSFLLDQIKISSDADMKDDLIAMAVKAGIGKMKIKDDEFSEIHYDYGASRIHGPSFAKFIEAYSKMAGNPDKAAELKAVWDEVAPILLQKEPEITLERLSVVTADGEAKLTGNAKIVGASAADLANPMMLISKVKSNLDVTLTDSLVAKFGSASQKDPEMQKMAMENMNRQISAFVDQGYINRNGKLLTSKLEWQQGHFTVNGKPFSR